MTSYRKMFITIVAANIVGYFSKALIDGLYGSMYIRSKRNNGHLWRFQKRMTDDLAKKRREAEEMSRERESNE